MNYTLSLIYLGVHYGTHAGRGTGGIPVVYLVTMALIFVASIVTSMMLNRRFKQYSEIPIAYTGAEVAEQMLRQNGIYDVQVISVPGQLTDHYDPSNRTVNLSESVYGCNTVAAAAVAAHECGHAIQHQEAYQWLQLRSTLVPAVSLASRGLNYVMILGMFGMFAMRSPILLFVWAALLAVTTLFSFVTLPVEFDASRRALVWLETSGLASSMEHHKAKNALFWAAMTYVVAALGSLAQLLHVLSMLMGRRD